MDGLRVGREEAVTEHKGPAKRALPEQPQAEAAKAATDMRSMDGLRDEGQKAVTENSRTREAGSARPTAAESCEAAKHYSG